MYKCEFCGFSSDNIDDFEEDFQHHAGYWCPYCDGFTYFANHGVRNNFFLLLENSQCIETAEISDCSVKIPSRVSPLRYPGGKSKVINKILSYCNFKNIKNWVEPYAGGASVGLALLLSGLTKELYINDIDKGIYSLFQVIRDNPVFLYKQIASFTPSTEAFKNAQKLMYADYDGLTIEETAWTMLVINRLSFSGICKANCLRNPAARWNPDELIRRIKNIHKHSDHIHVTNIDALEYIYEMYWMPESTLFIDPPYFQKGKQLYKHYYSYTDHDQLAFLLDELFKGMPGADIIVTYDMAEHIKKIYDYPDERILYRHYSIAN